MIFYGHPWSKNVVGVISSFQLCIDHASDRHGKTHQFINMVLILLSVIFAAIVAAISMIRHHIAFGSSTRAEITRENAKETGRRALRFC